jgi:hypothetical protein
MVCSEFVIRICALSSIETPIIISVLSLSTGFRGKASTFQPVGTKPYRNKNNKNLILFSKIFFDSFTELSLIFFALVSIKSIRYENLEIFLKVFEK